MDLDALIDALATQTMADSGAPGVYLAARAAVPATTSAALAARPPRWTQDEEQFYLDHLADLPLEDIAAALGRSLDAVKVHRFRAGLPSHRRTPGYLTAHQVSVILGADSHAVPVWIDQGVMPGERVPFATGKVMRRISWMRFKMWLVRPESWIYFDPTKIRNTHLRRLVELAQARWGDEWWTTQRAGQYHGCPAADIQHQIVKGRLPGLQARLRSGRYLSQSWAYWYVRRSEVERLVIPRGKGCPGAKPQFTPRADAFMLKAARAGATYAEIARMMKRGDEKAVAYRLRQLGYRRTPDWIRGRKRGRRVILD